MGEYTLEVIAAPGHTPGQICLWMANQQVLFTADHVLFDITPNITMWPNLPNALGRYLESLTRIGTYPARLASPATGTRRIWPPGFRPFWPTTGGGRRRRWPLSGGRGD